MAVKKITIIVCSYNNSEYLYKCISSIFNQSVSSKYYDVIIIDDNSLDNSLHIIDHFKEKKNLIIIKNKKNRGLVYSCNKAIKYAKTDFIIRVDSDDYISKKFVEIFLKYIKKDYEFIFSNYNIIKGKNIKKININNFNKLISCSVALKKKILIKIGGYRNFLWEEYDLYLRYLKKTNKIKKIDKYLYNYARHKKNMTKESSWRTSAWKQLNKVYKPKNFFDMKKKLNIK